MDALFRKYYWLVKLLGIGAIAGVALSAGLKFFLAPKLFEPVESVISFKKIKIEDAKKRGSLGPVPNDARSKSAASMEISALNLFCPSCVPQVVAETLGHSRPSITIDTYVHALPCQDRMAADAMDRLFKTV